MRILVLSSLYPPRIFGGAEKSAALIAQGLVARGHDVSVLTLHEESSYTDTMQDGVRVLRRPMRNLYWPFPPGQSRNPLAKLAFHAIDRHNPLMTGFVEDAIRQCRPDIMLSNLLVGFSASAWKAAHRAGVPVLHSLRDFYLLCPKSSMFRNGAPCAQQCTDCRLITRARRRMSDLVGGLTSVSQYMIDRHRAFGLFRKALLVPPILSAVNTPAEISRRVTAPPEAIRQFGFIGSVEAHKGIDKLLDGLLTLPQNSWALSIAGKGSDAYREHLNRRCAGLPVTFLGFVPEHEFYNAVDVVVVPSLWEEPLPRTVLEAFGYGLTVIASHRGGIAEVVRANETGYLVDLDQPEQMEAAVARAVFQPEEGRVFGAAGRRRVARRTLDVVAAEYETASLQVIDDVRRLHQKT